MSTYTPTYTPLYGGDPTPGATRIGPGLGQRLFAAGYDISGDIGVIDHAAGAIELLDVTRIRHSALARIGGVRDGSLGFTAYFNPGD